MNRAVVVAAVAAGAASLLPSAARAERPRGTYRFDEATARREPRAGEAAAPVHRIIFMNRDGGTYYPGTNDSSNNSSTIPDETSQVPAWSYGDAAWQDLMDCTIDMFAPFNITITDEDPGETAHVESVVGGRPEDVQLPASVGGVAPMNCSVIERAVVFTFSEVYFGDIQEICHTVAQEAMHAYGLDHELLCEDPMTYLGGCGPKTFQDVDAPCGEDQARLCQCGSMTQNSYRYILEQVGRPDPVPPTVSIVSPADGATVPPRFTVVAAPMDDVEIHGIELWLDGEKVSSASREPWEVAAPADVSYAAHAVEVRATDRGGNVASAAIVVTVAPECGPDAQGALCPAEESCVDGRCATALGTTCVHHADCASGICAASDDEGFDHSCTQTCDAVTECPPDLECGRANLCWPSDGGGGEGCTVGSGRGGAAGLAGAALLALVTLASRRSRRR